MLFKQLRTLRSPDKLTFSVVSTIAFPGYLFAKSHLVWFVIFYFDSSAAMIFELKLRKI